MRVYRKDNPSMFMYYRVKHRAKKLNLPFDLEPDDIHIPKVCPVLNIPLKRNQGVGRRGASPNSPSLDRIVPELGYVRGNVMVISVKANSIKNDATPEELMRVACFYAQNYPSTQTNEE